MGGGIIMQSLTKLKVFSLEIFQKIEGFEWGVILNAELSFIQVNMVCCMQDHSFYNFVQIVLYVHWH
jgi:hypothetical protein